MSAIFPRWTNWLPVALGGALALVGGVVTAGVTYYFTPKYTRVGYQPVQPVPFSHAVHAGQIGLDCRYCHYTVEKSWFSALPAASTCMNCHSLVLKDDPRLAVVRASFTNNTPIPWVQVHLVPDYVYFNHEVHVARGISCAECHGRVDQMDEVHEAKSFSMSFCLNCHRQPAAFVRPINKVTDLAWQWNTNPVVAARMQWTNGVAMVHSMRIESLQSCSTCHR